MSTLDIHSIQMNVADYFKVKFKDLVGPKRHRSVAHPRMVSMYFARKLTKLSFPEIGAHYGGKDHSTVISAVKKIERLFVEDEQVKADIYAIEARLRALMLDEKPEAPAARPCPERADGGPHEFTPDIEYDASGATVNCEHCGEEEPPK